MWQMQMRANENTKTRGELLLSSATTLITETTAFVTVTSTQTHYAQHKICF